MNTNQEDLSYLEQIEDDLNKKIDKYDSEIADFFDLNKPVPDVFVNGEALREDYKTRSEKIIKRNNCVDCELNYFKAHYIEILVANLKNA